MNNSKSPTLAVTSVEELIFGRAPRPVTCGHGVRIGAGEVIPEINFTLPSMVIEDATWPEVRRQYREMLTGITQRALELECRSLVVEFEHLPPLTGTPEWGGEITALIREILDGHQARSGLQSALRVTPVDIRDGQRPPRMRGGQHLETMLKSFRTCAQQGADLLAIESTGGKEVHDEALVNADLAGIVFALGVLAPRDVRFLWTAIVDIAAATGTVPSGDTACGFANTAMILADQRLLPAVLAAVIRVMATVRTLQAHQTGAVGPTKDCAYEGPYIKTLTGVPISMEGRSSACAHLSRLGNIAGACCDLWSNESVNNVRLLSTYAPVVSLEQLVYDTRLMNTAAAEGPEAARQLQRWLVASDAGRDPQAFVLDPRVVLDVSRHLVQCSSPYDMTLTAADRTLTLLREAQTAGTLQLVPQERKWLDLLSGQLELLPQVEEELVDSMREGLYRDKFSPGEYGL